MVPLITIPPKYCLISISLLLIFVILAHSTGSLSSILNRTASKTLATLIKKDPQLKRSYDKFFDSADEMKRLLAKKYGKDSSNYKALYPNG